MFYQKAKFAIGLCLMYIFAFVTATILFLEISALALLPIFAGHAQLFLFVSPFVYLFYLIGVVWGTRVRVAEFRKSSQAFPLWKMAFMGFVAGAVYPMFVLP